jgi:hypothetical protein
MIRQHQIIAEVVKIKNGCILFYDATRVYKTSSVMFNAGIGVCSNCGHIQPLEMKHCANCLDELFIVRKDIDVQVPEVKKPKTRKRIIKKKSSSKWL